MRSEHGEPTLALISARRALALATSSFSRRRLGIQSVFRSQNEKVGLAGNAASFLA